MKNKKMFTNIALIGLSVLAIIFLALPYVGGALTSISGYNCFDALKFVGNMEFKLAVVYITPLVVLIASLLILISSVLKSLADSKVIKCKSLPKVLKVINVIASIVFVISAIVAFICALILKVKLGVGIILILVIAILSIITSILNAKWSKK